MSSISLTCLCLSVFHGPSLTYTFPYTVKNAHTQIHPIYEFTKAKMSTGMSYTLEFGGPFSLKMYSLFCLFFSKYLTEARELKQDWMGIKVHKYILSNIFLFLSTHYSRVYHRFQLFFFLFSSLIHILFWSLPFFFKLIYLRTFGIFFSVDCGDSVSLWVEFILKLLLFLTTL
jgi:hypothetical protein